MHAHTCVCVHTVCVYMYHILLHIFICIAFCNFQFYALSESLNSRIEELGKQLNGSFAALITQLQHNVDRNLSWSEGNITVNLTDQRQIALQQMNNTYQLIFQQQQNMLVQVVYKHYVYSEYKISTQIWLAIYRKCHLVFNHSIANVQ